MSRFPKVSCIAAVAANGGIGKNNELPWRLPREMKYFARMTKEVSSPGKQNAVVMGRKTWDSIPLKLRPLRGRINVVLSQTLKAVDGAMLCSGLQEAIDVLTSAEYRDRVETIWIVGGSTVYKDAVSSSVCHRLYLTHINKDFDCDTFFPEFDKMVYKPVSDEQVPDDEQEENGVTYRFCVYERKE
jgi:dihydrofolate reductase